MMTLKNLEAIYKESYTVYDLSTFVFLFKEKEIPKVDEELSLGVLISKVVSLFFALRSIFDRTIQKKH